MGSVTFGLVRFSALVGLLPSHGPKRRTTSTTPVPPGPLPFEGLTLSAVEALGVAELERDDSLCVGALHSRSGDLD